MQTVGKRHTDANTDIPGGYCSSPTSTAAKTPVRDWSLPVCADNIFDKKYAEQASTMVRRAPAFA